MRLWHYQILYYLPKSQLLAQWRELNSIFATQPKHILINYVYEYPKADLFVYTNYVLAVMIDRGIKVTSLEKFKAYFEDIEAPADDQLHTPFKHHHDNRYLLQCFYNLQEKFDRGQKDFDLAVYNKLITFMRDKKII